MTKFEKLMPVSHIVRAFSHPPAPSPSVSLQGLLGILVRDKKWQPFPIVSYLIDFHPSTKPTNVKLLNVKSMLSAHRTKSPPLTLNPQQVSFWTAIASNYPAIFQKINFMTIPDYSWKFLTTTKVRPADPIRLCFSQECPVIYRNFSGIIFR